MKETTVIQDLGDGLILRRTTRADAAALADFNLHIHLEDGQPEAGIGFWTRDLLRGNHPTFHPDDFVIVEEQNSGKIVSATCLIDQTWTYEGIPFAVGRPELVGTLPEYRRRGLVRQIFEVVHGWSAERGQKMQAITGIPWYYRQFGYEMCVTLDGGRMSHVPQNSPTLKKGEKEAYRVRPATAADLAFIKRITDEASRRYLVNAERDEALWRYELEGRTRGSVQAFEMRIVETLTGEAVGFLAHSPRIFFDSIAVAFYEVVPGTAWTAVTPSVLRYLQAAGEKYAKRQEKKFGLIFFMLGTEHPLFQTAPGAVPREQQPYAWYIRIPDVPDFVRLIAPVIEKRLAQSTFAGISGQYRFNFYRSGMRLVLEKGCIKEVEPWRPERTSEGEIAFPEYTFLQVLLGHRTPYEIKYMFPDHWTNTLETRALVSVMFPKKASRPWGVA